MQRVATLTNVLDDHLVIYRYSLYGKRSFRKIWALMLCQHWGRGVNERWGVHVVPLAIRPTLRMRQPNPSRIPLSTKDAMWKHGMRKGKWNEWRNINDVTTEVQAKSQHDNTKMWMKGDLLWYSVNSETARVNDWSAMNELKRNKIYENTLPTKETDIIGPDL